VWHAASLFMKELQAEHGDTLQLLAIHTSQGHRRYERDQVEPQLRRFADQYARLPFPVHLDLSGELAREWGIEGTPYWFVFDRQGELVRDLFGSQENAQTRLRYLVEELLGGEVQSR